MQTTIVIPCYNEADRLDVKRFIEFARHASSSVKLLFVNDGSKDTTREMLQQIVRLVPQKFAAIHLPQNQGKAEAVRQGVCEALARGCDAVGYWDADLATPLGDIETFREVLLRRTDVDLVVGTRLPLLGRAIVRHPVRRLLGRTFATAASAALGLPIFDTQCGAKLFRVTPATMELFTAKFHSRWIFDVELLARWINRSDSRVVVRQKIYEHPLEAWEDVPGSKLRPHHFVQAFSEMAGLYLRYLRPWAPPWQPALLDHPTARKNAHEFAPRKAA